MMAIWSMSKGQAIISAMVLSLIMACSPASHVQNRELQPPFDEIILRCDSTLFPNEIDNYGKTLWAEDLENGEKLNWGQAGILALHSRMCEDKDMFIYMHVQEFNTEQAAHLHFSRLVADIQELGGHIDYSTSCCKNEQASPCPCRQVLEGTGYSGGTVLYAPQFTDHQPDEAFIMLSTNLLGGRLEFESAAQKNYQFRLGRYVGNYRAKEVDPPILEGPDGWAFGLGPDMLLLLSKSVDTTIQQLKAMP